MTNTSPQDPYASVPDPRHSPGTLMAIGIVSLIAGIIAVVYPSLTLLGLALCAGINILFFSALSLGEAFSGEADSGSRALAAIVGVLGIIAGIVVLKHPGQALLALIVVIGLWLIVDGIVSFFRAFGEHYHRGWRILGAIVDVILGILILSVPGISLHTLAIFVGIAFLVKGTIMFAIGWQLHRADSHAPHGAALA